jgi:hypothetical protein
MTTGSPINTSLIDIDPRLDPPMPETREHVIRAARTPFSVASRSSAASALVGVTTVALAGNPRLALRAALVVLQDRQASRSSSHGGRTHGRRVRRGL